MDNNFYIQISQSLCIKLKTLTKHRINGQLIWRKYCPIKNIRNLQIDASTHDHEEADTLLILHAYEVVKRIPFSKCVIFSPDTDVFLILIYHYESIPMAIKFWTGKGEKQQYIDIGKCFKNLGPFIKASSLFGFHTLTGCDQTGKLSGKSKFSCWKTFMKSNEKIIDAFASLGKNDDLPRLPIQELLENYVVQLYTHCSY